MLIKKERFVCACMCVCVHWKRKKKSVHTNTKKQMERKLNPPIIPPQPLTLENLGRIISNFYVLFINSSVF